MKDTINIKVKVTKEILRKSMMCGVKGKGSITKNCAIALAVREIFQKADVEENVFFPFGCNTDSPIVSEKIRTTPLNCTHNGEEFIKQFDGLAETPEKRLELPETEVTLFLTEECVDHLNSVEGFNWREVIEKSELLSFEG